MGYSWSKKKIAHSLTDVQRQNIFKMFNVVSTKGVPPITRPMLQNLWMGVFSDRILELIVHFLFKKTEKIMLEDLEIFFYKMVEGTAKDRAEILIDVMGKEGSIPAVSFEIYVTDLIESYITILRKKNPETFSFWVSGDDIHNSDLNIVKEYFLRDIKTYEKLGITELEQFLIHSSFVNDILKSVMKYAFNMEIKKMRPALPRANKYSSVLSVPMVLALSHLVHFYMKKDWRLLYSLLTDAQSWNILHGKVAKQGPTIVLVEDSTGPLFGGFASQSWKISPNFYGDECCFLFRLRPKMEVFLPTGYNNHFQYMNFGAVTLPNGMGMGGQLNYFTFFLNSEFGSATISKTCTTFKDYVPFASRSELVCSKLEIWAIGDIDTEEENVRRTSLTKDPTIAVILELSGKTAGHSKNFKEPRGED